MGLRLGVSSDLLLVHSPLVGPSVWRPLAAELTGRGATVACPDLTGAVVAPLMPGGRTRRQRFVADAAAAAMGDGIVLVGFSGAGVLLPNIAALLGDRVTATVFVDAVVPPAVGRHELGGPFAAFIETQAVDGVLNPWIEWWPEMVPTLLPDETLRRSVAADMPRVPLAFFGETLEVPAGWTTGVHRYLQLSRAYDADLELAQSFGWPTATIEGTHLSIATDPVAVCDALDRLVN